MSGKVLNVAKSSGSWKARGIKMKIFITARADAYLRGGREMYVVSRE